MNRAETRRVGEDAEADEALRRRLCKLVDRFWQHPRPRGSETGADDSEARSCPEPGGR